MAVTYAGEQRVRVTVPADFATFDHADLDAPLAQLIERQVARAPKRLAVQSGDQRLTYGALNAAANRLARQIVAQCGDANDAVALLLPAGIPAVIAALALLKVGKIYAPVDLTAPPNRARFMLANAQARLLLTDGVRLAAACALAEGLCPVIDIETIDTGRADNLAFDVNPDWPAFILHTSGSTGLPKGVVHSQRIMLWFAEYYQNETGLAPSDRTTWFSTPSVIGAMRDIFSPLLAGASIFPRDMRDGQFGALARLVLQERLSVLACSATLFRHLLSVVSADQQFPDVRFVKLGAEPVSQSDVATFCRHFRADCVLETSLGSTEAGLFRRYMMQASAPFTGSVLPAGYGIAGKDVLLLDDDGNEVAAGDSGEIAVRSKFIALGYWRLPELTQAKFRPDPAGSGATIFLSGDLGRLEPDGCLVHLGRKDQQVKVRGFRIETAEVEMRLAQTPGVKEAVVAVRPDQHGENRLVAYIVQAAQTAPSVSVLRQSVAAALPAYMVPSAYVFVESFPLAASGKVIRRLLPVPAPERPVLDVPYAAPRAPIEQALARIWADVLSVDQVGLDDPFLDLGGHSLQAARIIARVLAEFRVELPVRTVFEAPTIAAMGAVVAAAQAIQIDAARLAELLNSIESLPEAEAQRLLAMSNAVDT